MELGELMRTTRDALATAEKTLSAGVVLHAFHTESKREPLRSCVQSEARRMKSVGLNFKVDLHPSLSAKMQAILQGRG